MLRWKESIRKYMEEKIYSRMPEEKGVEEV